MIIEMDNFEAFKPLMVGVNTVWAEEFEDKYLLAIQDNGATIFVYVNKYEHEEQNFMFIISYLDKPNVRRVKKINLQLLSLQ